MSEKKTPKQVKRCSISVSGLTYDRLRSSVGEVDSIQKFVDRIVANALDDPKILERVAAKCWSTQKQP